MRPAEPGFFEAIPVSSAVNKVANVGPELQERMEEAAQREAAPVAEEPKQMSLF
jgi:hypothetical protein